MILGNDLAKRKERLARRIARSLRNHEEVELRPKILEDKLLRLYAILYSAEELRDQMNYYQWRGLEQTDALVLMHGHEYAVLRQGGRIVLESVGIGFIERAFTLVTVVCILGVPTSDTAATRGRQYIYIK